MDPLKDRNLSLKLFVELVGRDGWTGEKGRGEWSEIAKGLGDGIYREILLLLTQTEFEPETARQYWFEILEHRDNLKNALGRDPGIQVAVCDYFTNIRAMLKDLVMVDVHAMLQKERSALVDELTGLFNRRYFNKILHREIETARRFEQNVSLLFLDVDRFKDYNDAFGHPAGDRALVELADVLQTTARAIDHITRYGGEEFVIVLPRTGKDQAMAAAERYRSAIEKHYFPGEEKLPSGRLTVTIGAAAYPDDGCDGLELLTLADAALLKGKRRRNTIVAGRREKRSHPRYPLMRDMALRVLSEADESLYLGHSRDISLGGLGCLVEKPVAVGRHLDVVLTTPESGDCVQLPAQVVRLSKDREDECAYLLALSFRDLTPDQAKTLEALFPREVRPLQ
jgi:diguanylate cyclase (GGDEF)-like protein